MNKKFSTLVVLMVLLSLILSACAAQPTPAVVAPTQAPPTDAPAPTEVPPTPEPEPELDLAAVFADVVAGMEGYAGVNVAKLSEELADKPPFLVDVREASEVAEGYIEGAIHIPVRELTANLDKLPAKDQPIVIYCGSGHRSAIATTALLALGYKNVRSMTGGINAWKKAEMPLATDPLDEPESISEPEIENQALYEAVNAFMAGIPDGFYNTKPDALNALLTESQPFLLDIRRAQEYDESGYIAGAVNVPFEELFTSLDKLPADKSAPLVVYCGSGHRSALALPGLVMLGYENVINLGGGIGAWKTAQFPVEGWVDWNAVWVDFFNNLQPGFYSISAGDLNAAMAENPPILVDVREAKELEGGFIEGAIHIPVRDIMKNLDLLPMDQPIVIYCGSGHRAGMVVAALKVLGYEDVRNLGGGIGAWKKAELPLVTGETAVAAAGEDPQVDPVKLEQLDLFFSEMAEGFYGISPADLNMALGEEAKPYVLDVRTPEEVAADGYIEGSVLIPVTELGGRISELPADKSAPIVVMCKSGHRASFVTIALRMMGYSDVRNLGNGMNGWLAAELPVVIE